MSASLLIDYPVAARAPEQRRLAYCLALSALIVAAALSVLEWPVLQRGRGLPLVVDLLPRQKREQPQPLPAESEPAERAEPVEPSAAETAEAAAATPREEDADATAPAAGQTQQDAETAPPPAVTVPGEAASRDSAIDWQAAMESASARVIEEHNAPASMHPEFDELRRAARERYSEPQTGKSPPIREQNVELDIYGRKLLWLNDSCYQVLDDTNVGNLYAFETFEKHMTFCVFTLGKRPPRNLPWVAEIVVRYPYLRYPDGEIPPPEHD